jgi:hypothetical protein
MRAYQGYRARTLERSRPPGTAEVLRAVPRGSRRLLGKHIHRLALDGASMHPAICRLYANRRDHVLGVLGQLAHHAVYEDGTAMLPRQRLAAELGISISTWQRCYRILHSAGFLGLVRPGRCYHDGQGNTRNDAAVYVICAPKRIFSYLRKKGLERRRARLRPKSDPPTGEPTVLIDTARAALSPGPEEQLGPPSGRADMASPRNAGLAAGSTAGRAMAEALRQAGGPDLTDGWCGHITRPYLQAGWTAGDLWHAVTHMSLDGEFTDVVITTRRRQVLQSWLEAFWLDGGVPRQSPSQRRAAAAAELREHQAAEQARRAELAAAARPPSPDYLAMRQALFPGLPIGGPEP